MITVWKEVLNLIDFQVLELPKDSKILTVQLQYGKPTIWFQCDPDLPKTRRRFAIVGTGNEVPFVDKATYIGTYLMPGAVITFVFHLYEIIDG